MNSGSEIKHQYFRIGAVIDHDPAFRVEQERISCGDALAIDLKFAAHQMHIGFAFGVERQFRRLVAIEQTGIDCGVRVYGDRPCRAIG